MTLPLSPRASYLGAILLTATSRDTREGRIESLGFWAGQASEDDSLTDKDRRVVLQACDDYRLAIIRGRIP